MLKPDMSTANRPYAVPKAGESSRGAQTHFGGYRSTRRHRAQIVLLAFGLVSAVFSVVIAMRAAFWLPFLQH